MDSFGSVPAVPPQPRFCHLLERHLKHENMTKPKPSAAAPPDPAASVVGTDAQEIRSFPFPPGVALRRGRC